MRIVFFDTNKLFGAARYFLIHGNFDDSRLQTLLVDSWHTFVVSVFILQELTRILREKIDASITEHDIIRFQQALWLELCMSYEVESWAYQYVHDPLDAQVLQDAVSIQADWLITNNIADFDSERISHDFGMTIGQELPVW